MDWIIWGLVAVVFYLWRKIVWLNHETVSLVNKTHRQEVAIIILSSFTHEKIATLYGFCEKQRNQGNAPNYPEFEEPPFHLPIHDILQNYSDFDILFEEDCRVYEKVNEWFGDAQQLKANKVAIDRAIIARRRRDKLNNE